MINNLREYVAPAAGAIIGLGTMAYHHLTSNFSTYANVALTALVNCTMLNMTNGNITNGNMTNGTIGNYTFSPNGTCPAFNFSNFTSNFTG